MRNKILMIMAVAFTAVSCNWLDIVPKDSANEDDFWKNALTAERLLYRMYTYRPEIVYSSLPGQPFGGDDLMTSCKSTTKEWAYKSMMYGEETPSVVYHNLMKLSGAASGGVNYALYEGIRYAYLIIENVDRVPDLMEEEKIQWKGESWFLIGLYHWYMLEYYGPIVLSKGLTSLNAPEEEIYIPRSTFDECVDFIAGCYDKAAGMLPARQPDAKWYGRATAVAAYAMKARLLLYAASPLFNGNTEFYSDFRNKDGQHLINQVYDKGKWKRALDACYEAILYAESNGYKLYKNSDNASMNTFERGKNDFHDMFVEPHYNDAEYLFTKANNPNWAAFQRASAIRSEWPYSTRGFFTDVQVLFPAVEMYYTKNGLPLDVDPLTKGKDLYKYDSNSQTAVLNLNREPRFYACVTYNRGTEEIGSTKKTVMGYAGEIHGYTLASDGTPDLGKMYNNSTGYFSTKVIHKDISYQASSDNFYYHYSSYPIIRLAELYLSYAEADFEYNGVLSEMSYSYLDKVRERCGLPSFRNSWSIVGGVPEGDELRKILHQERSIEFLFEGHRYRDMRRWLEAEECMNVADWKVWNVFGTDAETYYKVLNFNDVDLHGYPVTFESPKHYLLPIPQSEIQINSKLVQNPGY
jgi:hypothetical protein